MTENISDILAHQIIKDIGFVHLLVTKTKLLYKNVRGGGCHVDTGHA